MDVVHCPTCGAPRKPTDAEAVLRAAEAVIQRALAEIRAEDEGGSSGALVPI
jgi:hypothetical protein